MIKIDLQPTLIGETITLRPLLHEDFSALHKAASNPAVWKMHPDSSRYKRDVFEERFFIGAIASGGALAVLDNETGRIVGSSRYYKWNADQQAISIGYTFLEHDRWGTGTNREMKGLMLNHVFAFAVTVWFHVGETNIRSRKAVEKIGATLSHKEDRELEGRPYVQCCRGLQLTNFNVEAECTPSRSALMTGRYGIRTRQREDGPPRGVWYGITKWEVTPAEMLSDSGYATGIFGKWHLGDTVGRYPTDQGFDEWIGLPRSSDRAFWPNSNSFTPGSHPNAVFTHVMSAKRGETPKELAVYDRAKRKTIDREITDQAIDFINRKAKAKQPFCAIASPAHLASSHQHCILQ